jgi:hypothetical protein
MDVPFLVWPVGLLRTIPFNLDGRARAVLVASGSTVVLAPDRRRGGRVWLLCLILLPLLTITSLRIMQRSGKRVNATTGILD